MMTMSIAMTMNLLNGQWSSKTQGEKSLNKRRALTHCLRSRSHDGLVYVRSGEEVLEVTDSCFKKII